MRRGRIRWAGLLGMVKREENEKKNKEDGLTQFSYKIIIIIIIIVTINKNYMLKIINNNNNN